MKFNPIRYSSAVGESWHHFSSKTKYCHKIFDIKEVREECCRLLVEAFERNSIRYEEIGFDNNHFHAMVDLGLYSRPQLAKLVRGYVGKKLLEKFSDVKLVAVETNKVPSINGFTTSLKKTYSRYTAKLMRDVENNYGNLNIVKLARVITADV